MADIFLSYASQDRAKARSLDAFLKARSYSIFWDRESIPVGWAFDDFIEKELRDAKAVIVLWSKFAAASRWVRIEAKEALGRGILVPAVIEKIEQQTIPLEFRHIHSADLSIWDFCNTNLEVERLLEAVDKLVGKKPATEKSPNLGAKDISAVQVQDSDLNSSDHPPALDTKSLSRMSLAPSTNIEQSHRINTSENQHKVRIKIISFAIISLIVGGGGGGIWYFWRSPVGLPKSNQEEHSQPPQSATDQKSEGQQASPDSISGEQNLNPQQGSMFDGIRLDHKYRADPGEITSTAQAETTLSRPAFPPGTSHSRVRERLGEPTKITSGLWNTTAWIYDNLHVGYLIDRQNGQIRQSEISFPLTALFEEITDTLSAMTGTNSIPPEIERKIRTVYSGQQDKARFLLGDFHCQLERQDGSSFYLGVWDKDLK